MGESRPADADIADSLAGVLGCSDEDRAWLGALLELFPIPRATHAHHLVFALERLRNAAPWWPELVGDDGFFESLARVGQGLRAAHANGRLKPASAQGVDGAAFSGSYLATATLLSDSRIPSKGSECLRAFLVGLCWRWTRAAAPRQTSIEDIARTVRAVAATKLGDPPVLPDRFLLGLGGMLATQALSIPPRVDESAATQGFADAWNRHVVPEVERILAEKNQPGTPEPIKPPPAPKPPGGGESPEPPRPPRKSPEKKPTAPWASDEEPTVRRQLEGYRRRVYVPGPDDPEVLKELGQLEPGESTEEVVPLLDVLPMESAPRNRDARDVATYQVAQAIWGRNGLLVPNHVDVLPHGRLCEAFGTLASALDPGAADEEARPGLVGLFLQILAGRAAGSLKALNILPNASHPHDPRSFDLLVEEGMLRFSVFWQVGREGEPEPSFFRPDENAALHLEPTESVYCLPLIPAVIGVLRQNIGPLQILVASSPGQVAQYLRDAATWLSEEMKWPVTQGAIRGSFGVHLFEQCRDLALTQLLAADTFGNSTAPLAYYAPKVQTLAETYWAYQASLLPNTPPMPRLRDPDQRVGSRLLASSSSVADMVKAMTAPLRRGVAALVNDGEAHRVHHAMVCQMTGMLVAALTHRPGEALLALNRWNFLIDGDFGAAQFFDKRVDGAHNPRLVVLPRTACRQLKAYLDHLMALAELRPALTPYICEVLRGERPIFFKWDGQDTATPLSLADWAASMPEPWQHLPFNWGRHWCRTRAVELGVRPEFLNMQMGHLEAIGYPFSGASPTEPAAWVEELAPAWDAVVRAQGWRVLSGLTLGDPSPAPSLPPLQLWEQIVEAHRAEARAKEDSWREALRARMRRYREEAEEQVLAHAELVKAGITARYRREGPEAGPHSLTRADFEHLRDGFLDDPDEPSLAKGLAKAQALCRIARIVNRRTSQHAENPPPLCFPRRPLDNAFIPGMMLAVSQVHALREHLHEWSGQNKPGPKDDFPLACARTALALMLFGYCDDPTRIRGMLAHRHLAMRSAAIKDLIIVPWGSEPGQVFALRGLAAIALAKLARKFPQGDVPEWGVLAARMGQFLPDWVHGDEQSAGSSPDGVIKALLQTVSMANRYELSPAARVGIASGGCFEAHPQEQIALVDGDPAGSLDRAWLKAEGNEVSSGDATSADTSKGSARTQYLALCAVFPRDGRDTRLLLTDHTIPSGEADDGRHRKPVMAEIQAMLDAREEGKRLQPVVRLLAAWCLDMLTHGTERRKSPALSTIETYLSRVGGPLVHVLAHRRLDQFDEVELEEAYLAAVECKPRDQAAAAATMIGLHQFGRTRFGLADADLTPLYRLAGKEVMAHADARLILPSERDRMLELLEQGQQAAPNAPGESEMDRVRLLRQARAAAEVLVGVGARHSEVLGLQVRNVVPVTRGVTIMIRPNPSRRLKSPSARRNVVLEIGHGAVAGLNLQAWVDAESARLPERSKQSAYVFAPISSHRSAKGREKIAGVILKSAKAVTGLPSARAHQFRHLFAIESLTPVFLTDDDRAALEGSMKFRSAPTLRGGVALPRDLRAQSTALGHADPLTTLTWYYHLPFLLRSRSDAALAKRHLHVNTLATLLGVTRDAVRWPIRHSPDRDPAHVWMDHEMEPRVRPQPSQFSAYVGKTPPVELQGWTAAQLSQLFTMTNRTGLLEPALVAIGASPGHADLLRATILPIEQRLGRCLLTDKALEGVKGRPKRRVRLVEDAAGVEKLWQIFDRDTDGQRRAVARLARQIIDCMTPTDGDRIRLPSLHMAALMQLLKGVGIEDERMQCTTLGAGMSELRVRRKRKPPEATDSTETSIRTPSHGGNQEATPAEESGQEVYLGLAVKRVFALMVIADA